MTIPFKQIPGNLRVPLFYAELDASKANTQVRAQRTLIIAPKVASGTLVPDVPVVSQSQSDARAAAGAGSVLAGMVQAYRQNDPTGELWLLPLSDGGAGVAATGTLTVTGTSTGAGTVWLYIAGQPLQIGMNTGTTAAQAATIIAATINAAPDLPVSASAAAGVVTITADNKGEPGNDIDFRVNYRGAAGGEVLPTGLAVTIVAMSGGNTNLALTTALGNLTDTAFDFIVTSMTDPVSLAAIAALLNDTNGRWSWSSQTYGHCFFARRGSAGALAATATGLNSQHLTMIGYADSPSPSWVWAAAFAGAAAAALRIDPGQPLQTLPVIGVLAPPIASRFSLLIRNATLLYGGVSTWVVDPGGGVVIENLVTTYVTDGQGQADDSYLQVETLFTLMFVLRRMRDVVTAKYSRVKLAADGTRLLPGSNVVTPSVIRADVIAAYRELEADGMVQGSAAFAANLVVEKDAANPNRVNVLWPAILVSQLRVFALLAQFRQS